MADKWVELSEEQIEQLLSEAETRLSAQGKDGKSLSKPSKADVAPADASKPDAVALKASQPTSTSEPKEKLSVRVPEVRRGKKEKVCNLCKAHAFTDKPSRMMKIISQFN